MNRKKDIAPDASSKSNWSRWQEWWMALAVFGATYGFVVGFLDPASRYFASAPLFRLRSDFFLPHLQRPGGLLGYASSFLAQLDFHAWLGGWVYAALVVLVSLVTRSLLRRSGASLAGVWICPGLGLLLLYGQTSTPASEVAGGLLLALALLWVVSTPFGSGWNGQLARSCGLPAHRLFRQEDHRLEDPMAAQDSAASCRRERAGSPFHPFQLHTYGLAAHRIRTHFHALNFGLVFSVLTLLLLYVAGPLPCLLFIVGGGLHEWRDRRTPRALLACGVWIAAWLAGAVVAGNSWVPLSPKQWPDSTSIATLVGLYAAYPILFLLGTALLPRRRPEMIPQTPARKPHIKSESLPAIPRTQWWPGAAIVLVVLAVITFGLSRESVRRHLNRVQAAAEREDWRGVLNAANHLTYLPPAARLQLIRALYHLGRLNDELFVFPQQSGVDLLPSLSAGLNVCLPLSDTLLELGQVNLAEHYAQEAVEVRGERPELLWRMARINLVKERPQAARVYLNLLGQAPFYRGLAARWLGSLDRDPTLAGEAEIVRLRSLRPISDLVELRFATDQLLLQLLSSNRRNGMAIEYLMTHFLLTHQARQVMENIARLDDAGRRETPRHIAEAILAFAESQRMTNLNLQGRQIDSATLGRFERIREHLRSGQPSQRPVPAALAESFGDTYWFYDLFGQSAPPSGRRDSKD